MEIKFTVEQLHQLLGALGEVPFKYSKPIIEFVSTIAQPQIAAAQEAKEMPQVSAE